MAVLAAAAALWACDDSTGASVVQRNESDLNFLHAAPDAPPLVQTTASFWAVRGEDSELRLSYRPRTGSTDSTEFLRMRVRDESLVSLPGGLPLADGDSVLISVSVIDAVRMIVEFQPAGLQFAEEEPVELKMRFREADDDYNGDGSVDGRDSDIKQSFRIWRQGMPGEAWAQVGGRTRVDLDELEADLTSFSRYAVAY